MKYINTNGDAPCTGVLMSHTIKFTIIIIILFCPKKIVVFNFLMGCHSMSWLFFVKKLFL